jgi:hypothetical protein
VTPSVLSIAIDATFTDCINKDYVCYSLYSAIGLFYTFCITESFDALLLREGTIISGYSL